MSWVEEKYLSMISSRLPLFKQKKRGLYNCRCPICGDSQKSKTKARGYFYDRKGKLFYNCKNCGASTTFPKFLQDFDATMFKEFRMEEFKDSGSKRKVATNFEFEHKKIKFKKKLGLLRIYDLPKGHPAITYLEQRKIPEKYYSDIYFAENMKVVAESIDGYEDTQFDNYARIVFPFYDNDGNITYVQGRSIDPETPKANRYVTLELIKDAPRIFGLDRINKDKPVKVVEGPIDSLFLDNAVALAGADLFKAAKHLGMKERDITIVADNEPRNKQIVNIVKKCIDLGYRVCMLPDTITGKDINDYAVNGYEPSALIDNNTFHDLVAKVQFGHWKKI